MHVSDDEMKEEREDEMREEACMDEYYDNLFRDDWDALFNYLELSSGTTISELHEAVSKFEEYGWETSIMEIIDTVTL